MSNSKKGGFGKGSGFGGGTGFGKSGGFGGGTGRRGEEQTVPYANPHKDPFRKLGEVTGDLEKDNNDEIEAISESFKGFKKRAANESKRFELAVDAAYWAGICFRSQSDCDKFFQAVGYKSFYRGQHVDGYQLAKLLGLEIEWDYPEPLKKPKGTDL